MTLSVAAMAACGGPLDQGGEDVAAVTALAERPDGFHGSVDGCPDCVFIHGRALFADLWEESFLPLSSQRPAVQVLFEEGDAAWFPVELEGAGLISGAYRWKLGPLDGQPNSLSDAHFGFIQRREFVPIMRLAIAEIEKDR